MALLEERASGRLLLLMRAKREAPVGSLMVSGTGISSPYGLDSGSGYSSYGGRLKRQCRALLEL